METDNDKDIPAYEGVLCEILGYHSGVVEVSNLLRYYVVPCRLLFRKFLRTVRLRLRRQCELSKRHNLQPHQRKLRTQNTLNYHVLCDEGTILG